MERLIEAVELQKRIHEHHYILTDQFNTKDLGMFTGGIDYAIQTAPTIDAVPVRHGEWIDVTGSNGKDYRKCSECLHTQDITGLLNYCPVCGAKMDGNAWEEPEINPCRDCEDYDGKGGCKSNGGCGVEMDGKEQEK